MKSRLRDLSGWKLSDRDKDIRGWPVRDDTGREIGRVDEMIVDTDTRHVESVILGTGAELPVSALDLGHNEVFVDRDYAARFAGTGRLMTPATTAEHRATERKEERHRGEKIVIPIIEEQVEVGKQHTESGARVRTSVTERPVEKEVTLRDEKITVDRHPADRVATDEDLRHTEGETEVRAVHEEPLVRKTDRVVEEVAIGKEVRERKETVRDTARKTKVDVDTGETKRKR